MPIFIKNIKQTVKRFMEGKSAHYAGELPEKPYGLLQFLFLKCFGRIELSSVHIQAVKELPRDAAVVYVNRFESRFEFLYANTGFSAHQLPPPVIGVDYDLFFCQTFRRKLQIAMAAVYRLVLRKPHPDLLADHYLAKQLQNGRAVFMSLVGKKDFYLRFLEKRPDPLQYLIRLQKNTSRPIYIVPQLFFYTKTPETAKLRLRDIVLGSDRRPGTLRKLFAAFFRPDKMFVELSQPISLKTFIADNSAQYPDSGQLAMRIRQEVLDQMTRHRQSTTGPILKSYDEIRQGILTDRDLQAYLNKYAQRREMPLYKARTEAVKYFDEIAAKYRPGIVALTVRIVHWISSTFFEGIHVDIKRFKQIKTMALNGPVVFVPCHRSHIDSLVMLATTYTNHLSPPHIFAGKNLSFWPMGPLLRMIGVFFVRRSFQGAVFYTKVFSAYISRLIEEGYHLNVFIEGTRSRSGKLLQPQLGMLTILMDVFQKQPDKDLIFVPVYIGYDQVPEEKEYLNEVQGGNKKPENARQLVKFGKLFQRRFGKIYVKFTDPISLKQYLADQDLSAENLSSKEKNRVSRHLGKNIMTAIDHATVVTPQSLAASALLNSRRPLRNYESLWRQIESYMVYLNFRQVDLSESLLINPKNAIDHILNQFVGAKMIDAVQARADGWEARDTFKANKNRRLLLDYYKNNCIIHFIPAAYTACAILVRDTFQFQTVDMAGTYEFLSDLFAFEFTHDPDRDAEYHIRRSMKAFIEDAIIIPHATLPDTYAITSPGFRKLKSFMDFLTPFVEAYWVVFKWLTQEPKKNMDPKNRIKKIINFGNHLHKNRSITRIESLSVMNIENAVFYFNRSGLRGAEDTRQFCYYEDHLSPIKALMER